MTSNPSRRASSDENHISLQKRDVPAFGAPYDKARKAYGISSALLLAWELVGIELQPAPVESLKVTLKSPQAAPYVLIALVMYFAFRMTIEWFQG